ncbi:predicted protein [Naegleria gruberi]|uniref:Predicted protein n=1 Tax=Naegleria gruberi TaxID=5762 RepID=D2VTG3_NAEGR|nr:uncharacterized protein NAEGRDRAFT_72290 [Naegleria gruberi]EFC39929.1 predicted protein [Naegleria gruberi]|eukprot:XP_002672673.1 predicted protein [Naegleria gruberi strain NEG-M]
MRKISSFGNVQTIAGGIGDKGPAINAKLRTVYSMKILGDYLYFSDTLYKIRKISLSTGLIDSVVGGYVNGYNGDNLANQTNIRTVLDMQFHNNELVFADTINFRIRKTSLSEMGMVTTIAGNGSTTLTSLIDNVPATSAYLKAPASVAFLSNGEMIIAERQGHVIRKVDLTGQISLIAGSFLQLGLNGDSSNAKISLLNDPLSLTVLKGDRILFVDRGNNRIRMLTPYCKDSGYFLTQSSQGMICSNQTTCFGFAETDSKVCSGNGICQSFNNCACKVGYMGSDCSTPNICTVLTIAHICTSPIFNAPETLITPVSDITLLNSRNIELPSVKINLPPTMSVYLEGIDPSLKNEEVVVLSSLSTTTISSETLGFVSPIVSSVIAKANSGQKIPVQNLADPVAILFENLTISNNENLNVSCIYFDETAKEWKSDGIETKTSTDKAVSVTCNTYSLERSIVVIDQNYKKESPSKGSGVVTDNSAVLIGAIVGSIGGCCVLLSVLMIIIVVIALVLKRKRTTNKLDDL